MTLEEMERRFRLESAQRLERTLLSLEQAVADLERLREQMDKLPELIAWRGAYPGFCRDPELCRGLGYCPRERSCVD